MALEELAALRERRREEQVLEAAEKVCMCTWWWVHRGTRAIDSMCVMLY